MRIGRVLSALLTLLLVQTLSRAQSEFAVPNVGQTKFRVSVKGRYDTNGNYTNALKRAFTIAAKHWNNSMELRVKVKYERLTGMNYESRPHLVQLDSTASYVQVAALTIAKGQYDWREKYHIEMKLNSAEPWHVGAEAPPSNAYDLTTVVLQQLYQHLMFSGFLRFDAQPEKRTAWLRQNRRSLFDTLLVNNDGCAVLGYRTNRDLKSRVDKGYAELLGAAITHNRLRFMSADGPKLHAPYLYDKASSVYHLERLDTREWSFMQPNMERGKRVTEVPSNVLDMQREYIKAVREESTGASLCQRLSSPFSANPNKPRAKSSRARRVGGMPIWAFGLCMVVLVIVLTVLLFAVCTIGAIAKQKEKRSCWKRLTWCCTGVDIVPNKADKPVFVYVDDNTARKVQASRTSADAVHVVAQASKDAARASMDVAHASVDAARERISAVRRASVDAARHALGVPSRASAEVQNVPTVDITDSPPPPAAETQLPGRLQYQ